jgi:hypothetical protein
MLEDNHAFSAVVFSALPQDLLSRQLGEANLYLLYREERLRER